MNMRQSAGMLAAIAVLLAGMSLVARSSPPAATQSSQTNAPDPAMAGGIPCGTSAVFDSEVTPMTDLIVDESEWFSCVAGGLRLRDGEVDFDGDGVDEIYSLVNSGFGIGLVWAKVNGDGSLDGMPPIILDETTLNLPALGDGESREIFPLAFRDMNGDGLPDAIITVRVSGPGFVSGRVYYTLNILPPPPPPLVGDVDGDGIVGILDFLLVLENWTP